MHAKCWRRRAAGIGLLLLTLNVAGCAPERVEEARGAPAQRQAPRAPTADRAATASTVSARLERSVAREVRAGEDFQYELRVTNLGHEPLRDAVVVERPQGQFTITGSIPQAQSLPAGGVRWDLGALPPGESRTITVQARAGGAGSVQSCALLQYHTQVCADIPVVQPRLELLKSAPEEVLRCDPIPLVLVVTNTGTGTVRGVRLIDELPDHMTGPDGQRTLTLDAGDLAPGQSRTFQVQARASARGQYVNQARATAEGGLSAEAAPTTTQVREPVLALSQHSHEREYLGQPFTIETIVRNTGDGAARNTVLEHTLPQGARLISAGDGGRASGRQVTWNLGTLMPDDTRRVSVVAVSDAPATLESRATARADCADAALAHSRIRVEGLRAVLLEVVDLEDPVRVGDSTTYQITVSNQGSAADRDVVIVCTLEESMEYVSSDGPTRAAVAGRSVRFEPLPTLAPGAKATWQLKVRAARVADARFRVDMTSGIAERPVTETEATNFYE